MGNMKRLMKTGKLERRYGKKSALTSRFDVLIEKTLSLLILLQFCDI
jgi:hypothetical protein